MIAKEETCRKCPAFGKCTTALSGRKVMRLVEEELRDRLEKEYILPDNQAIYKKRQQKIELIFGHIRRNLGVSSFLLRGREGARAEMSLLSICFNITRMLSLLGFAKLIAKLKEIFCSENSIPSLQFLAIST
jgi:hypothetical protein